MVLSMSCVRSFLLVVLLCLAGGATRADTPDRQAACAAARDRALQSLAQEAISIESALDNDAAVSGAPEYDLQETRDAVIADIERERDAVQKRYRACIAEKGPPPPAR